MPFKQADNQAKMDLKFYQHHLDRVSRSFAFCIAQLDSPLRSWVSMNYLLCRVLDTIEDAPWDQSEKQRSHFQRFEEFIKGQVSSPEVKQWALEFPSKVPRSEKDLLLHAHQIFLDLKATPPPARSIIQNVVEKMSRGMQHFLNLKADGQLKLESLSQVNQYCFFVAGLVGEALAKLVALVENKFEVGKARLIDAHHFGLFLQKINLLKDQAQDEREGRFLVPSREEVFLSLKPNAQGALRFLCALPEAQLGFRQFCAWSLFLGVATLPVLRNGEQKLPRAETEKLILQISEMAADNHRLQVHFENLMPKELSQKNLVHRGDEGNLQWFQKAYPGPLGLEELSILGLGGPISNA